MNDSANSINDGNPETLSHWEGKEGQKPLLEIRLGHVVMRGCEKCEEEGVNVEAVRWITVLKRRYRIVITSSRGKSERNTIMEWLQMHDVPFDELRLGEPYAVFRIDARAIAHRGWSETIRQIAVREEAGRYGQCPECGSFMVGLYTRKRKEKLMVKYCRECDWEGEYDRTLEKDKGVKGESKDLGGKSEGTGESEGTKGSGRKGDSSGANDKGSRVQSNENK